MRVSGEQYSIAKNTNNPHDGMSTDTAFISERSHGVGDRLGQRDQCNAE
jgi:hypothetical protein